jgi:hypothetical protein
MNAILRSDQIHRSVSLKKKMIEMKPKPTIASPKLDWEKWRQLIENQTKYLILFTWFLAGLFQEGGGWHGGQVVGWVAWLQLLWDLGQYRGRHHGHVPGRVLSSEWWQQIYNFRHFSHKLCGWWTLVRGLRHQGRGKNRWVAGCILPFVSVSHTFPVI